ncbi:MAG: hypothetical protein B7Y36_18735 [Novosphingobium sp. 28-62-57]|uniref:hypothetical protein n=1 Tax=Novosphingobium sp. 28-62-57 TaxID=1970409 RepID=UPI000BD572EA|nr:hypothetical protein [Novosphingobium sp. 28-62-57]OYZ07828.1 MAG: hypothetical protein B7Y36_18735 [Novosphingobium sp. 28-62-57]OYZ46566.1 MAG: hypothetical protein B7Y31_00695 [Novosphingobium sp. 16-62-11]OZA36622.1 MAG: hypothetical protein B7X92_05790 [Novosphingobium sp. 17-62-9]HQS96679.1 hypothetical protein [Novosphingobium sp.]
MRVFPTYAFSFSDMEADIERQVLTGGTALSGSEDVIAIDGGGRVFAQFGDPYLDEPEMALAWKACGDALQGGALPVIVPLGDLRHQFNRDIRIPLSLPWWTEAEYATGASGAALSANAALRATTLLLALDFLPGPLRAGMWLSINHVALRHRAYRIKDVVSQTSTAAEIELSHPLREATLSGVAVELHDPRCVMRLDGEMRSPSNMGYATGSPIRFVEHFPAIGETYP